jgi:hypothetical protein
MVPFLTPNLGDYGLCIPPSKIDTRTNADATPKLEHNQVTHTVLFCAIHVGEKINGLVKDPVTPRTGLSEASQGHAIENKSVSPVNFLGSGKAREKGKGTPFFIYGCLNF